MDATTAPQEPQGIGLFGLEALSRRYAGAATSARLAAVVGLLAAAALVIGVARSHFSGFTVLFTLFFCGPFLLRAFALAVKPSRPRTPARRVFIALGSLGCTLLSAGFLLVVLSSPRRSAPLNSDFLFVSAVLCCALLWTGRPPQPADPEARPYPRRPLALVTLAVASFILVVLPWARIFPWPGAIMAMAALTMPAAIALCWGFTREAAETLRGRESPGRELVLTLASIVLLLLFIVFVAARTSSDVL